MIPSDVIPKLVGFHSQRFPFATFSRFVHLCTFACFTKGILWGMCHHVPKGPGLFSKCSFTTINRLWFRQLKSTVNWFFRSFGFIFRTFDNVWCHGCWRSGCKFTRKEFFEVVDSLSGNFIVISDGSLVRYFDLLDFIIGLGTDD